MRNHRSSDRPARMVYSTPKAEGTGEVVPLPPPCRVDNYAERGAFSPRRGLICQHRARHGFLAPPFSRDPRGKHEHGSIFFSFRALVAACMRAR